MNTDVFTLGPNAAAIKRRVGPARWQRLVQTARRRGVTIDSFLDPSIPNPLKARTKSSLTKQAYDTVAKSYAPAEQQLTQQEGRIKAISDKRALDNQYYLNWLTSRQATMATHAQAAESALLDAARGTAAQTPQDYAAVQQRLQQGAAQTPGNVSNPAQATAFDLTPEAKRAIDRASSAVGQTADHIALAGSMRDAATANDFAFMASQEAKRTADTWAALHDVADSRTKLELQRGQDAAKEIARLLDQEISKANANRDYAAAAARLGISQQNADVALGQLNLGKQRLGHTIANDAAKLDIQRAKLAVDQDRAALGWYKAKHPTHKNGQGAKSANPQDRFEYGYAVLGSSTRDVTKGGKTKSVHIDAGYVSKHQNEIISQVQAATKLSRKMATLIVRAYILHNGSDPGTYGQYLAPGVTPSGY